jgi:hypothetical protein
MAIDKKITYEDQRLTKAQQKKVKPVKQAGIKNFLGKQETVTVPKKWLSSPDHVVAELAYITPREQKILLDVNLYGSLNGQPNRGPGEIMSLQGAGDRGGSEDKGTNDDGSANSGGDTSVRGPAELGLTTRGPPAAPKDGGSFLDGLKTIGTTVKDYVTSGGTIGMGLRGISSLVDKVTGPKAADYNAGYNIANVSGPKSYDFGPGPGRGESKIKTPVGIMAIKEITPIGEEVIDPTNTASTQDMNFNFGTFSNPIYKKDLV